MNIVSNYDENVDFILDPMYDTENASNGGVSVKSKELLVAAIRDVGITQAELSQKVGWVPQQLSSRLARNSMKADDFLNLLDAAGIDIVLNVRESGKPVKVHITGAGRRLKGMVDRVTYDTAASDALSNNFYADGVHEYTDGKALELYMDKEGRYFFAEYTNWEGGKDRISPVSAGDAAKFIEKYGTTIDKSPEAQAE